MKKISELTKQELGHLVMTSDSYSSIYRKLGYTKVNNHTTLKSYMKKHEIDVSLLGISIENKRREIIMYNEGTKLNITTDSLTQEAIYIPETDCIIKEISITFSAYNLHDSFDVLIRKINNCDNTPNQLLVKEYSPMIHDLEIPLYTRVRTGEELVIRFNNNSKTEKNIFIKYHIEEVEKNIYDILKDISDDWDNISKDTQFSISTLVAGVKQECKTLSIKEIISLGQTLIHMTDNTTAYYNTMHKLLQEQFKLMCDDMYTFEKNKCNIFRILSEIIDSITPNDMSPLLNDLFRIKQFKQGERPEFKIKPGHSCAKATMTSNYNVFRLDNAVVEVPTIAYGGACQIVLDLFIDGVADFNEIIQIIMDELFISIKREAHYALYEFGKLVTINRVSEFNPSSYLPAIEKLVELVDKNNEGVYILTGDKIMAGTTIGEFKEFPRKYNKHEVILLPPFENNNDRRNRFIYVIPKSIDKMFLLALEGKTLMRDIIDNAFSKEFQVYRKIGVTCIGDPIQIGLFENTARG